jgi:hypothetical protein
MLLIRQIQIRDLASFFQEFNQPVYPMYVHIPVPNFLQIDSNIQLGNYLGALSNWVKLQKTAAPEDELLFSIVGWHALTLPQDSKTLSDLRMDMLATLLAIGIDPKRSIVFHQDQVSSGVFFVEGLK